jgi:hypothetical protein
MPIAAQGSGARIRRDDDGPVSHGPALLFYALLLVLPITALMARRVPATLLIKVGVVWIAIFGLGMIVLNAIR